MYGEWMTVLRPRRRNTRRPAATTGSKVAQSQAQEETAVSSKKGNNKISNNQGSSFTILTKNEEDSYEVPVTENVRSIQSRESAGIIKK